MINIAMDTRIKSVIFDEKNHTYSYQGKRLYGVTQSIGEIISKTFPDTTTVRLATLYGSDIHKEVENYYNNQGILSTQGAKWVVNEINNFFDEIKEETVFVKSEVLVSDFTSTASKIDIVLKTKEGSYLFDIKTTRHFDRQYCSLQLSCYKRMYEDNYKDKVLGLYVLSVASKRRFHILEQSKEKVDKVFSTNKKKII